MVGRAEEEDQGCVREGPRDGGRQKRGELEQQARERGFLPYTNLALTMDGSDPNWMSTVAFFLRQVYRATRQDGAQEMEGN